MRKGSFKIYLILVGIFFILISNLFAEQNKQVKVGIDEKLGNHIPKDVYFYNSDGKKIKLDSVITKPTILALVYYHCPNVCSPLLMGVSEVVDRIELQPGKEFQVITLSFDQNEKPVDAKKWKDEHLNSMRRIIPDDSWLFLTGDSSSIKKVTNAVGFYFNPEKDKNFSHPASLIVLSPKGKVIRYIFGTQFLPFDVEMAITEASKGTPTPTINKILDYCFSYERESNRYVFNFKKVAGSIILLSVFIFLSVLIIKNKKRNARV